MSFVVDDLKEISEGADAAVAYFYCREQWQSSVQTKTGFLLNFARQLLDAAKDPVALATPFIDIRGHFKPDSINALLQSTIAEFTIVYLVIDALEKFSTSKDDRADLINSLRDISDGLEPGKLRICVTSTEADEIVDLLDDPLQIEISPNAEDIREYVAHELDAGSMRSDFLSESLAHHPHLRDKIINSIVDNNDGSFRTVKDQLHIILRQTNRARIEQAANELKSNIDRRYLDTLKEIRKQHPDDADTIVDLLRWSYYSKRKLTIAELSNATAMKQPRGHLSSRHDVDYYSSDVQHLITLSGDLLAVRHNHRLPKQRSVQLARKTVRACLDSSRHIFEPEFENHLGASCLRCLDIDNDANKAAAAADEKISKSGPAAQPDKKASSKMAKNKGHGHQQAHDLLPLTDYANNHFGKHIHNTTASPIDGNTKTLLYDFVDGRGGLEGWLSQFARCKMPRLQPNVPPTALEGFIACSWPLIARVAINRGCELCDDGALYQAAGKGDLRILQILLNARVYHEQGELISSTPQIPWKDIASDTQVDDMAIQHIFWQPDVPVLQALVYAAEKKHLGAVELLLAYGMPVNTLSSSGNTALYWAVRNKDVRMVDLLVDAGADVDMVFHGEPLLKTAAELDAVEVGETLLCHSRKCNAVNKDGESALVVALHKGHEKFVKMLLQDKRIDVNARDGKGKVPLVWTIDNKRRSLMELLLARNVDVNQASETGKTALWHAVYNNDMDVMRALLSKKANANQANIGNVTPLMVAASEGHVDAVKLLLESSADPNFLNDQGETALTVAVRRRRVAIVQCLLSDGRVDVSDRDTLISPSALTPMHAAVTWTKYGRVSVDICKLLLMTRKVAFGARTDKGATVLHAAAANPRTDVFGLLLSFRPDIKEVINSLDDHGRTPLHLALREDADVNVINALITAGAEVNTRSRSGETPMHLVVLRDDPAMVDRFLEARPNLELTNKHGETVLAVASCEGVPSDTIDSLLCYGCNVNVRSRYGRTPLIASIHARDPERMLSLLDNYDVDINFPTGNGQTPLMRALVVDSHTSIVDYLLYVSANPLICDKDGDGPLDVAAAKGRPRAVRALIKAIGIEMPKQGSRALCYAVKRALRNPDPDNAVEKKNVDPKGDYYTTIEILLAATKPIQGGHGKYENVYQMARHTHSRAPAEFERKLLQLLRSKGLKCPDRCRYCRAAVATSDEESSAVEGEDEQSSSDTTSVRGVDDEEEEGYGAEGMERCGVYNDMLDDAEDRAAFELGGRSYGLPTYMPSPEHLDYLYTTT